MKLILKIGIALAVLLTSGLMAVRYSSERQDRLEAEDQADYEAEILEMLANEDRHPAPEIPRTLAPVPADYDWTLYDFDGGELSLEQFRGKTLFIDVWATWCKPCRAQMNSIQRLYDAHRGEEYAFLLIAKELDDVEKVRAYLDEKGYTFPVYLAGDESPSTFPTRPLPFTFVVDPAGEIVYQVHGGPHKWDDESFVEFFRSLSETTEL